MLFVNVKFPIFYFLFCKEVFGRGARKGSEVHGEARQAKGQKTLTFSTTQ